MNIVVIDTETTWTDEVMSIGAVVASEDFKVVDSRYYLIEPACCRSAMYADVLHLDGTPDERVGSREEVMKEMRSWLREKEVRSVFAYNAGFDKNHMPELLDFIWYDIMKIAAYKQHNPYISEEMSCCKTGRLRSGYGVESIYRMLSGNYRYCEKHNGWYDATDELKIMEMLSLPLSVYEKARI